MLRNDEHFVYDFEGTADYLCKRLREEEAECVEQGYTEIRFELTTECDYGDDEYPRLQVRYKRPVTATELEQEAKQTAHLEKFERDNYLRLKAKFEPNKF